MNEHLMDRLQKLILEYDSPSIGPMFSRLKDMGLKHIGSGMYGSAYSYGNHVVKIAIGDLCWQLFVEFALKHSSKHLPKIHSVKRFNMKPSNRMVIITVGERLRDTADVFNMIDLYTAVLLEIYDIGAAGSLEPKDHYKGIRLRMHNHLAEKVFGSMSLAEYCRTYRKKSPLVDVIHDMINFSPIKRHKCLLDVGFNMMMRGRTVVINDPIRL